MHFESLTRRAEIGANSYLIDFDGFRVILDTGMHPKNEGKEAIPRYDELEFDSVDAIFVTHSHLDHSGTLPLAMRRNPSAPVFMTEPTGSLVEAMLHNSVNVMTSKRDELNIEDYPLFTHKEVEKLPFGWQYRKPGKRFRLSEKEGSPECEFFDAGHILGSIGIMFYHKGERIFYTGDVNFEDQTINKGAAFPAQEVDTLIVETTRGASPRDPEYCRINESDRLGVSMKHSIVAALFSFPFSPWARHRRFS
jgi:Cft2 family RNA processing exonuclease